MSHHVLQQFDEELLAEIASGDALSKRELLNGAAARCSEQSSRRWLNLSPPRQWLVLAVALLIAAFALLIAHDAQRRADDLQRRLAIHERASDK
ncbi:MAG TPA: hypothetical protein VM911_22105 [Pyrinomonadaceae bacterium]|jgi:hypothetical protein|nr:hypothetical protein [Pyrinomonadaceae bacterium]